MFELLLAKKNISLLQQGYSLLACGYDSGNTNINTTQKYKYNSDTQSQGTSLNDKKSMLVGVGNSSAGLFATGNAFTNTEKYNYSDDSVNAGSSLTIYRTEAAGTGNELFGLIAGGYSGRYLASTDKYIYSTNACSPGSSLLYPRAGLAAAGNESFGLFCGGYTGTYPAYNVQTVAEKYTYSTDVRTTSTAMSRARFHFVGASSPSFAIFSSGRSSGSSYANFVDTEKYIYSSDVRVMGTSINVGLTTPAAASGNANLALFTGGWIVGQYLYSDDTVKNRSNLTVFRRQHAATSSSPNWTST